MCQTERDTTENPPVVQPYSNRERRDPRFGVSWLRYQSNTWHGYKPSPSPWGLEMDPIPPAHQCRLCHCSAVHTVLLSQKPHPEDSKKALPVKSRPRFPGHVFHAGALTLPSSSVSVGDYDRSKDPHRNDNVSSRAAGRRAPSEISPVFATRVRTGLTLCPLPPARGIVTNAADCKRRLFSAAAEGPGVVLFLGVFWSPLRAVNWRQQKD